MSILPLLNLTLGIPAWEQKFTLLWCGRNSSLHIRRPLHSFKNASDLTQRDCPPGWCPLRAWGWGGFLSLLVTPELSKMRQQLICCLGPDWSWLDREEEGHFNLFLYSEVLQYPHILYPQNPCSYHFLCLWTHFRLYSGCLERQTGLLRAWQFWILRISC